LPNSSWPIFRALNYDDTLPPRPVFDQLLLTAHNRVRR